MRREFILSQQYTHVYAIESILVGVFFVLKCWHHRNEFRSISHVRINWKNSSVIQAGWIWIDRIYTFLWIWFIGSWVIDTFRQWTLKFSRKNALNGCDIARFFSNETTRYFNVRYLKYRKKYFNNAKTSCLWMYFTLHFRVLVLVDRERKNRGGEFQVCFFCLYILSVGWRWSR